MMFALLSVISYSAARVEVTKEPKIHKDACFDITYRTNGNGYVQTSQSKAGYFVAYRVHEENGFSELQPIRYTEDQTSEYNGLNIAFNGEEKYNKELIVLKFTATNSGNFSKTFDLGVFVDVNFAKDDYAKLSRRGDGVGVEARKGDQGIIYITGGIGVFDPVDAIFLGDLKDAESDEISEMPFFESNSVKSTQKDSVLAFSWQNRTVRPGESIELGFLARTAGANTEIPPWITDLTELKTFYEPNENINLVFNVTDVNMENYINVVIKRSNGESIITKLTPEFWEHDFQIKQQLNVGEGPVFTYSIIVSDDKPFESKEYTKKVFVYSQPVVKPTTDSLKPKYSLGKSIDISVEVTSQNTFFLKYYFDDGRILTAEEKTSARKVEENVKTFSIPITDEITADKTHTLTYYVEDENGAQSEKQVHSFEYTSQAEPEPEPEPEPQPEPTNDNKPEPEPEPEPQPEPEPEPEPEQTETVPSTSTSANNGNGGDDGQKDAKPDNSKGKSNLGIIIGCVAAGVAVVIIIVVVAVILIKKNKHDGDGSISEDEAPSQTAENNYFEE